MNMIFDALPDAPSEMDEFYDTVAFEFAKEVHRVWESEATLKAAFEQRFKHLEFTRTEHWSGIVCLMMDDAWRKHGPNPQASLTSTDRMEILKALLDKLDFNLYSQVALNLQDWSILRYDGGNVQDQLDAIAKKWEKYATTPVSKGAKLIKDAWRPQDVDFNKDLSKVKSLKTISGIGLGISFRVAPKGRTPAFADSQNFSTIGVGGDPYVKVVHPELSIWYTTWAPGSTPRIVTQHADGAFTTEGIPYRFYSKSGGSILNETLFARGVAFSYWSGLFTCGETRFVVLPRMNSVMVVTSAASVVEDIFTSLKREWPMLWLVSQVRS